MDVATKRKKIMTMICKTMDILDPSGANSERVKKQYAHLSDKEFDKVIRKFFNDPKKNFYLEFIDFSREISMDNIEKAAEYLKVPLMEHVAIPYLNNGDEDNIVVTPEPVPVGWIHEKRMQQTLLKKNSGSTSIKKRNPSTGQVINEDKNARNSDVETYSMIAIGAINGLKEMQGPRADDTLMKDQMYSAINRNGYVKLEDLDSLPENKVALNTLDAYFMMMGFTTNLVTPLDMISVEQLKRRE